MGWVQRVISSVAITVVKSSQSSAINIIVFFLFIVIITNTYVLLKHYHIPATFTNSKDFHVQLAKELIGNYCSQRRSKAIEQLFNNELAVFWNEQFW